mgnify:CR=1 FL=1
MVDELNAFSDQLQNENVNATLSADAAMEHALNLRTQADDLERFACLYSRV